MLPKIITPRETKICDFQYLISDWSQNLTANFGFQKLLQPQLINNQGWPLHPKMFEMRFRSFDCDGKNMGDIQFKSKEHYIP